MFHINTSFLQVNENVPSDASCIFSFELIRGETTQTGTKFAGKKKNQFGGQNEQKINQNLSKEQIGQTKNGWQLLPHARCSFVLVNPILARIGALAGTMHNFFKPKRATNEFCQVNLFLHNPRLLLRSER
jgi:hypothetical protein